MSVVLLVPATVAGRIATPPAGVDAVVAATAPGRTALDAGGAWWWDAARDAVAAGADAVWCADGEPAADALDALTAPLVDGRSPVLRSGSVVDPDGSLSRADLPSWAADPAAMIDLATVAAAPVTSASAASLLVAAAAIRIVGPPDPDRFGPLADREWTARAAAYGGAVHRPRSVVRRTDRPWRPSPAVAARHALALRRARVWRIREAGHRAAVLGGWR
ncbi:MAG: hypothetical protein M0P31_06475 [Solirubrobacteraceae bacterium]|nr:hypothetical protein [Solirubrobacteraceae bacterium]